MSAEAPSHVAREILDEIEREGSIPFSRFMELALYAPRLGYYTREDTTTGPEGDFSTSSDVSPDFGRRLARQVVDVVHKLGGGPWRLVEIGPGRGLLAHDVVQGLDEWGPRARDTLSELLLVELNPSLREAQRARLASLADVPRCRWISAPGEHEADGIPSIVIANELLDALPFHIVARDETGRLVERFVARDAEGKGLRFIERAPSDPRIEERVARFGLCPRRGQVGELCLALEPLFRQLVDPLDARAAILVDYGHDAERLSDEDHAEGSALAYRRHRVVSDLLARPGEQDLTAHVNWTHAEHAAREAGFQVAGRVTQERFLLALGIIDDLVRQGEEDEAREARQRRLAARALVLGGPAAGRRFQVLLLHRGVEGPFLGLGDPRPPA